MSLTKIDVKTISISSLIFILIVIFFLGSMVIFSSQSYMEWSYGPADCWEINTFSLGDYDYFQVKGCDGIIINTFDTLEKANGFVTNYK